MDVKDEKTESFRSALNFCCLLPGLFARLLGPEEQICLLPWLVNNAMKWIGTQMTELVGIFLTACV